jgi:hypothetical protein
LTEAAMQRVLHRKDDDDQPINNYVAIPRPPLLRRETSKPNNPFNAIMPRPPLVHKYGRDTDTKQPRERAILTYTSVGQPKSTSKSGHMLTLTTQVVSNVNAYVV